MSENNALPKRDPRIHGTPQRWLDLPTLRMDAVGIAIAAERAAKGRRGEEDREGVASFERPVTP